MECEFKTPVNYLGQTPLEGEPFQFQFASCSDETLSYIQNSSTEAEFYLDKTISYGDTILITLFIILVIFGIFKFVWNLVWAIFERKIL